MQEGLQNVVGGMEVQGGRELRAGAGKEFSACLPTAGRGFNAISSRRPLGPGRGGTAGGAFLTACASATAPTPLALPGPSSSPAL